MSIPQFIVARDANELADLLGRPQPYSQRGGGWFLDHEALARVVEDALKIVRRQLPPFTVGPQGEHQLRLPLEG